MKYIILQDDFAEDLEIQVNQKIGEGFEPLGGVCYVATETDKGIYKAYAQAMVKKEGDALKG